MFKNYWQLFSIRNQIKSVLNIYVLNIDNSL